MLDPTLALVPAAEKNRRRPYRTRYRRPAEEQPAFGPEWFAPPPRFDALWDRSLVDGSVRCLLVIMALSGQRGGMLAYRRDVTFSIGWMAAGLLRCPKTVREYLNNLLDCGYLLDWRRDGRAVRVLLSSKVMPEFAIRKLDAKAAARTRGIEAARRKAEDEMEKAAARRWWRARNEARKAAKKSKNSDYWRKKFSPRPKKSSFKEKGKALYGGTDSGAEVSAVEKAKRRWPKKAPPAERAPPPRPPEPPRKGPANDNDRVEVRDVPSTMVRMALEKLRAALARGKPKHPP